MKCEMEQERIPGWNQSTAAQGAAIQAHALTLRPVSQSSGLWQAENLRPECFTQYLDFVLNDIAKKHSGILREMLRVPVTAVLVADPTPTRNDRKLSPRVHNKDVPYMLIQLLLVSPVGRLSVSG